MATLKGDEIETVDGMAIRSGKIEFDASDLRPCGRCGRSNAPSRAECIYCGAAMGAIDAAADLKLRDIEPWERAFNVVIVGGRSSDSLSTLPIAEETLRLAYNLDAPTPVARVATVGTAEAVRGKLVDAGFDVEVLSDNDLAAGRPPVRLRSLSVNDLTIRLTTFNTGDHPEFPAASLELIVVGRLFEERVEQTLKKHRKGLKETDAGSVSNDSGVIDIYFEGAPDGFRILEGGFDFSCLGSGKSLLAAENMRNLVDLLRPIARRAVVSSDYVSKRKLLDAVWPPQVRNDSKGVQRSGFGVSVAKAEVRSNSEQFTKYSRLVRRTL